MIATVLTFLIAPTQLPKPNLPPQVQVVCQTPVVPLQSRGTSYLVYELQVTNLEREPLELQKVIAMGPRQEVLGAFDGGTLKACLSTPDGPSETPAAIPPGKMILVYMWLEMKPSAVPSSFSHHLVFQREDKSTAKIDGVPVKLAMRHTINVGPPLRGSNWISGNGPSNTSGHRRSLTCVDGHAYIGQRFAIDYTQLGANGKTFDGPPDKNESYNCYDEDILAVADGKVVGVVNGLPDNTPSAPEFAVAIEMHTIAGNHVILDLGHGMYAAYAHMIPGSIRVKLGQRVKAGQVLGKLGNTGSSSQPHLHFQIMNAPSFLRSEGLPYGYHSVKVRNLIDHPEVEDAIQPSGKEFELRNEMPLEIQLITFPPVPKVRG